jgi:hypothetical protein
MAEDAERKPPAGVDVVVPCYQYGRFLRQCVSSILHQEQCDVRVLIIDNASTDESVEVAQQLAAEDARVEVVARRRNLGPHASFNEGIDWARSDYFAVLCADDLLAPGALGRSTSIMERYPNVHLTYGKTLRFPQDGAVPHFAGNLQDVTWRVVPGRDLLERCVRGQLDHQPLAIVRTAAQQQLGYYRPELPHTDDLELWMRFACLGSVAETDAIQGLHRTHPSNRSASMNLPEWLRQIEAAFESFFAQEGSALPDAAWLHRTARRSLAGQAYWCALSALCRRQASTSVDLLKLAFRLSPTTALLPPLSYLLHRDDALQRIGCALSAAVGWPRATARPATGQEG